MNICFSKHVLFPGLLEAACRETQPLFFRLKFYPIERSLVSPSLYLYDYFCIFNRYAGGIYCYILELRFVPL